MNNKGLFLSSAIAMFFVSLLLTTTPAYADDIEIYGVSSSNKPPVNIMFIFDLSGSMSWDVDGNYTWNSGKPSRKSILLDALTTVMDENKTKTNLRVGFTWFNGSRKGIRWPTTGIADDINTLDSNVTAGTYYPYNLIPKQLSMLPASGSTDIVGSLYEAAKYFRGAAVTTPSPVANPTWNSSGEYYTNPENAHWLTYTPTSGSSAYTSQTSTVRCKQGQNCVSGSPTLSNERNCSTSSEWSWYWHDYVNVTRCDYDYSSSTWAGATYNSPIDSNCQANYIILLSDGQPTANTGDDSSNIPAMIGKACADSNISNGKCGTDITEFLAKNDNNPGIPGSKVKTYTIGFNIDGTGKSFLQSLAQKGDGEFYGASSASDLEEVFDLIIDTVTGENENFTGLVTSIRASSLSSDNRVFMNMFKPSASRSWAGNTKGYFISKDGLLDVDEVPALTIIDSAERFSDSARSFWSGSADGNYVERGGASGKLNAGSRDIYTFTATTAPSNSSLVEITKTETTITPTLLNVANNTDKDALIDWLYESKMVDPLHPKPVLIPYASQDVLFSMTNQGLLHAIDATNPKVKGNYSGGSEIFAFVPQALLGQLKDHKANANTANHLYGLDGGISHWHNDTNEDKKVNNGEKAYLYFGMRRGGNHYYALDVSTPSAPKLAWRIDGGSGDFAQLGQTWSRMVPTTVNWNGNPKKVLIFGGGYDTAQDAKTTRSADTIGNAVYMVDASTGSLLWSAQKTGVDAANLTVLSDLKYSVPSDITPIDSNNNRLADRLYFGDLGGQVWRIDLDEDDLGGSVVAGFRMADFAADSSTVNNRRFFFAPNLAKVRDEGEFYYAVTIGSGWRAHPLSTIEENRFYMIKDTNTEHGSPATAWTTINENGLYNITDNVIGQGTSTDATTNAAEKAAAQAALDNAKGWILKLKNTGEKNLSPSLIFDYKLAFTTYTPAVSTNTSLVCGGGGGSGRLYVVDLLTGVPEINYDKDNNQMTVEDRYDTIPGIGIPSEPITYFPENIGSVDIYIGKHKALSIDNGMARINWKVEE